MSRFQSPVISSFLFQPVGATGEKECFLKARRRKLIIKFRPSSSCGFWQEKSYWPGTEKGWRAKNGLLWWDVFVYTRTTLLAGATSYGSQWGKIIARLEVKVIMEKFRSPLNAATFVVLSTLFRHIFVQTSFYFPPVQSPVNGFLREKGERCLPLVRESS